MNYSKKTNGKRKKNQQSKAKKVRSKFSILAIRIIIVIVILSGFTAVGLLAGAYIGIINEVDKITINDASPKKYTSILYYDGTDVEYARFTGDENRESAPLEQMPKHLQNAAIAIEDQRFREHNGVDIKGLFRAVYVTLTTDRTEGASTLTQQVIKNNVKGINRNDLKSKIQEQYLAVEFEKDLRDIMTKEEAKDYILGVYLNTVTFGDNMNGVQTAAWHYFGKDVSELTLSESAAIISITNNPSLYHIAKKQEGNKKRQTLVLKKMLELEYITQAEYDEALADPIYSRLKTGELQTEEDLDKKEKDLSYYKDQVIDSLSEDLEAKGYRKDEISDTIYGGGLKINVVIDQEKQDIVDSVFADDSLFPATVYERTVTYSINVKNTVTGNEETLTSTAKKFSTDAEKDAFIATMPGELIGPNHEKIEGTENIQVKELDPQPQAAFVLMDHKQGYVRAIVGGRGKKKSSRTLNRATKSTRSPGSVFKVLAAFAPSLDMGKITAASVIDDVPSDIMYDGKSWPNNWYSNYRGLRTVREAIAESANIVTVKVMNDAGIDKCFEYLHNFGFTTLDNVNDRGLSTALGGLTKGVNQAEVAAAYGAIANLGQYNKPKYYSTVLDHSGKTILDTSEAEPESVLDEGNAYILTDLMKSVIKKGYRIPDYSPTGVYADFQNLNIPIAGKTGTTTDNYDLTFVGYTPYYVGSIWFGHDIPKNLGSNVGRMHVIVWREIMERVHQGLEEGKDFEKPVNKIDEVEVCRDSGKLPKPGVCNADPRGTRVIKELFVKGTTPVEECDVHSSARICSVSGLRATEYCPAGVVHIRTGIVRPKPYVGTATIADRAYEVGSGSTPCNVHTEFYVPETTNPFEDFWNTEEGEDMVDPFNSGGQHNIGPSTGIEGNQTAPPRRDEEIIPQPTPQIPAIPPPTINTPPRSIVVESNLPMDDFAD